MIHKNFAEFGYDIRSMDDLEELCLNCNASDISRLLLAPFVDEYSLVIYEGEQCNIRKPRRFPRVWKDSNTYANCLAKRKRMLPSTGVLIKFSNAGEIASVYLREVYKFEKIILLFRVEYLDNTGLVGYYNQEQEDFFSEYELVPVSNSKKCQQSICAGSAIKNFVLEVYSRLTTNIAIDRKRNLAIKFVDAFEGEFCYSNQPLALIERNAVTSGISKYQRHMEHSKEDYYHEERALAGFIRKLPDGQRASLEAQQFSRELGYELEPDETYVKPHVRHVRKLKKCNLFS